MVSHPPQVQDLIWLTLHLHTTLHLPVLLIVALVGTGAQNKYVQSNTQKSIHFLDCFQCLLHAQNLGKFQWPFHFTITVLILFERHVKSL